MAIYMCICVHADNMSFVPTVPVVYYITALSATTFRAGVLSKDLGFTMTVAAFWYTVMFIRIRPDLAGLNVWDYMVYPALTMFGASISAIVFAWSAYPSRKRLVNFEIFGDRVGRFAIEIPLLTGAIVLLVLGIFWLTGIFTWYSDSAANVAGIISVSVAGVIIIATAAWLQVWDPVKNGVPFSLNKGFNTDSDADKQDVRKDMRLNHKYFWSVALYLTASSVAYPYFYDIDVGLGAAYIAIVVLVDVCLFFWDASTHWYAVDDYFWYPTAIWNQTEDEARENQSLDRYIGKYQYNYFKIGLLAHTIVKILFAYIAQIASESDMDITTYVNLGGDLASIIVSIVTNYVWSRKYVNVNGFTNEEELQELAAKM